MTTASIATADQLCAAFAEFEEASQQLSTFYLDLEHQVARLTTELAASRAGQAHELVEKQRLAARLENLLGALPGGVVVLDQHGAVQEFNPAATELLGELSCGDGWSGIVARAFAPRWDDGHDVSLRDGRRVNIATQALSGEPGQILLLKDVTETRQLHDQLAHHKRLSAKTEMAAAMAHQIRTPLATALLNLGNVQRAHDEAGRNRAIERGLQSLRKLERLVEEMLLFARGGQLGVDRIDVEDLVRMIATQAAEAFNTTEFKIQVEPCSATGRLYANAAALTSVALNLIDNACQACHGRGRLDLRGRIDDGYFELAFSDDGPGVPAAQAASVFEPFVTTRANGTGLGLAVARAVARAHAGDILLAPSRGAGACFVLRLPLIAAATINPLTTAVPRVAVPFAIATAAAAPSRMKDHA